MNHFNTKMKFKVSESDKFKVANRELCSNKAPSDGFHPTVNFTISEEAEVNRKLRIPRSENYLNLFNVVDLLSSTDKEIIGKLRENVDEDTLNEFLSMSSEELEEVIKLTFIEEFEGIQIEAKSILKGVLSKCYIDGCDCHAIDSEGDILEHFEINKPMPEELEKGRRILLQYGDNCKCVEVYNNCCRVIMNDSSVITIDDE